MVGPSIRERVRWADLDIMGVVYYGRYVRFIEVAEAEFFRALGLTAVGIAEQLGVWLVRAHLEIDYRAPARYDDEIVCRAELAKIGGSSLRFAFPMERGDGTRLADAQLVLAAVDRETMRAVRLPAPLVGALTGQAGERLSS
jgi:YbgC/YbaW family acyl-CoA thioester hydrolase